MTQGNMSITSIKTETVSTVLKITTTQFRQIQINELTHAKHDLSSIPYSLHLYDSASRRWQLAWCSNWSSSHRWLAQKEHLNTRPPAREELAYHDMETQCGAVMTRSIFKKIFTKDTPLLALKGEVWVVFCGSSIWLIFCLRSGNHSSNNLLYQTVL